MDLDDASFLDAALTVVARYGMKRTTMADLARAGGVSRQTLYDRFGDKDGVMAAGIDHMAQGLVRELCAAFAARSDLAGKLDAYFEVSILPMYEMMRTMPEAADLEQGMGPASIAASRKASDVKEALLCDMLKSELSSDAPSPESVAAFVEQASCRAKFSNIERDDLERFLAVLKASVVALSHQP